MNTPVAIDIVVECQLLILLDTSLGKYSHPYMRTNGPLCNITVWITAVVGKTADTSAFRCIDKLKANQKVCCDDCSEYLPRPFATS